MKLIKLALRNFKGIRDFTLQLDGADASVYADNGVGKTTLHDAWTWLLFGKDSNNRADFDIKTLDENNRPIHGLDHEVEAVLRLEDGREVTLRKVYKEKWTKRRGAAVAEFTGHETEHYIDGVPVKKAEYDAYIAQLADEDVFRLLSDPTYFNEHLHWQERRKLLLEVCGDVTDADVIAANDALAKLPEILKGRKLDDHRKVIAARRAEINKQLETIPVRIDEVHKGLPELPAGNRVDVEARLSELRSRRQELEAERTRIQAGGAIAEYRKRLAEIEAAMTTAKNRIQGMHLDGIQTKQGRLNELRDKVETLKYEIRRLDNERNETIREIERDEGRMASLRDDWERINSEQFGETLADVADACAACGQPLPVERVEEARAKAQAELERRRAEFNERKSRRLADITAEGKRLKENVETLKNKRDQLEDERNDRSLQVEDLEAEYVELQKELDAFKAAIPDPLSDPEYARLAADKASVEQTIQALQDDVSAQLAAVAAELKSVDEQIASVEAALARFEAHERGLKRIEELKAEERKLAAEFEQLEHELFLAEEFTKTKVCLLDELINSRFRVARFKMFKELVNGGIEDTCETLLNGVPWPSINGAGKIQVGLDIINTLANHYGFAPPVFVDNAESVTNIPPTKGQQIRLIVSAADKTLRVQTDSQELLKEAS